MTRWIDAASPDSDWDRIEDIIAARGWMSLNKRTCRVRIAEDDDGHLLGFIVVQLVPHVGPLFVTPSARGTGLAESLADEMFDDLVEMQARGWVVIADSPHVGPLCEAHGMTKITAPVYRT